MIYSALNCQSARVFDVDTRQEIRKVLEVDLLENTLLAYVIPYVVVEDSITRQLLRYQKIHAIYAGCPTPLLFHCYGRIYED